MDTSPTRRLRPLCLARRDRPAEMALDHIQHGTFQRSMSLLVCGTSVVSGLEVSYEHYRGSYSNPVMYTPVLLSGVLAAAALAAFLSRKHGPDLSAVGELRYAGGWCDRVRLPYARHRAQAGRLAPAGHQSS